MEGNNDRPCWVNHDRPWVNHYAAWVNHDAPCPWIWAGVENNTLEVTSAGWGEEVGILAPLLNTEARIQVGNLSGDTRIGKDPAAPTSRRNYC